MNKFKEQAMKVVFMVAACASVLAVFLICLFLFANGLPAIAKIGPVKFLLGTTWKPSNDKFGIFPMIIASIYVTGGAILIGVPIALFTSVFMARYCPQKIYRPLKSGIELMAGVPSIVYGFFGLVLMVPLIRNTFGGTGTSWLAASLLLAIMILPTIMRTTEEALKAVPDSYREGSFGLGAGRLRTVFQVVLPSAVPGILAGIILAVGRIVGETAALMYTAGTVAGIPSNLFGSGRTLAVHMYVLTNEGLYTNQSYATAVVLLVIVVCINAVSGFIAKKVSGKAA